MGYIYYCEHREMPGYNRPTDEPPPIPEYFYSTKHVGKCEICMSPNIEYLGKDVGLTERNFKAVVANAPNKEFVIGIIQIQKENPSLRDDEICTLVGTSKDLNFITAMIELKKKDIIEYELKLSQFKSALNQRKRDNEQPKAANAQVKGQAPFQPLRLRNPMFLLARTVIVKISHLFLVLNVLCLFLRLVCLVRK